MEITQKKNCTETSLVNWLTSYLERSTETIRNLKVSLFCELYLFKVSKHQKSTRELNNLTQNCLKPE